MSNMKVLCVDIQGFNVNNEFLAKEVAITNGRQTNHYLFEMPAKYSSLSENDKKNVRYLTFQVHGLLFASGHVEYNKINGMIQDKICDADMVYVRGHQKKEFLDNILLDLNEGHLPKIINVENLDADAWNTSMTKFYLDVPKCMNHLNDHKKKYKCSLRNCLVLYNWISNNCMPL